VNGKTNAVHGCLRNNQNAQISLLRYAFIDNASPRRRKGVGAAGYETGRSREVRRRNNNDKLKRDDKSRFGRCSDMRDSSSDSSGQAGSSTVTLLSRDEAGES
jgi:hypothetical protein